MKTAVVYHPVEKFFETFTFKTYQSSVFRYIKCKDARAYRPMVLIDIFDTQEAAMQTRDALNMVR